MLLPQTLKRIENRAFEEDWCHAENIYDESLEDPLVEEHIITHGITELDIPPSNVFTIRATYPHVCPSP